MHKISRPGEHLLVEFGSTINLESIVTAIRDIGRRDDYARSNDIWVIGGAAVFLSHEDFETINQLIASRYPGGASRSKTALVCTTGFNTVVANMWCYSAARLPYRVKVFDRIEDAQLWVES